MSKPPPFVSFFIVIIVLIIGCKKGEDPVPDDIFVGNYVLQEVLVEFNPSDPDGIDEEYLAPELFQVTKSDFLNPVTNEMVTSYKFFINDIFLGISEQSDSGGTVLVGTQGCPNDDSLRAVSVTLQEDGLYRLNMLNCIGREVLADYNRVIPE